MMTKEYLAFAAGLAMTAGGIIRAGFDKAVEVESKTDGSPVTPVDRQINRIVAEEIERSFPGHGLLGEEADLGTGAEQHKWICDPLDGTNAYILGVPNSVFMLALVEEFSLLVSVVYDPFADRLYHAERGGGAFCNNAAIHVSRQPLRDGYVVAGADSCPFVDLIRRAGAQVESVSGTGYKSMMVARGRAVAMIKDTADFHDIVPAALIIEEAGGRVSTLDGSPLVLDREIGGVILSNGIAHRPLLEIAQLARARP